MTVAENSYDRKTVLALGLFDSVHRGHARLIAEAGRLARETGADLGVFTFRNNPFSFYGPDRGTVYTFEERVRVLEGLGADLVVAKTMDEAYSRMSPADFLEDLFDSFNVKAAVCGADYTFGHKGAGNADFLMKTAEKRGITVKIVPFLCDENGERISSTLVRRNVSEGNMEEVRRLTGRPYAISGPVVHSAGRGRTFGLPTANIPLPPEKLPPKIGVYATSVEADGVVRDSLTNVGPKPTFGDGSVSVESFILNFDGDLYGKTITVFFHSLLREVSRFGGAPEFMEQIGRDVRNAEGRRGKTW